MKKISLVSILILFLKFGLVSAYAEEEEEVLSGQELVNGCSEGYLPGKPNQYCMQYIFGLVTYVAKLQEMEPGNKLFCIDPTVIVSSS